MLKPIIQERDAFGARSPNRSAAGCTQLREIGSVYQAMMGFEVQVANGTSVGLRPTML
jgi:hypothetical protein